MNPLCEMCEAEGRVTETQEVHHIESVKDAPDKRLVIQNTIALCRSHHRQLEAEAALRRRKHER